MKFVIYGVVFDEATKRYKNVRVTNEVFTSRSTAYRHIRNNDAKWLYPFILNAHVVKLEF